MGVLLLGYSVLVGKATPQSFQFNSTNTQSVTRANFIFLATSIYRTVGGRKKLISKVAKCNREAIPAGHTSTSD